jgi:hypothetical protein
MIIEGADSSRYLLAPTPGLALWLSLQLCTAGRVRHEVLPSAGWCAAFSHFVVSETEAKEYVRRVRIWGEDIW